MNQAVTEINMTSSITVQTTQSINLSLWMPRYFDRFCCSDEYKLLLRCQIPRSIVDPYAHTHDLHITFQCGVRRLQLNFRISTFRISTPCSHECHRLHVLQRE